MAESIKEIPRSKEATGRSERPICCLDLDVFLVLPAIKAF